MELTINRKEKQEEINAGNTKDRMQENHKLKDVHRIIISKDAKIALDDLVVKANEGFDAGEISKSDLVNALLINSTKYFSESEIKALRSQHFDEAKVLSALLKGVSQGEAIPEKLKSFLRVQFGGVDNQKKKQTNGET